MIKNGSQVMMHYTLTVDDKLIESSHDRDPHSYVHGQGQIVPGLEAQLEGLEAGDSKTTTIPPEKAYGLRDPGLVFTAPGTAFRDPDQLNPGMVVTGQKEGRPFRALVVAVDSEGITLDMNHPLAGKTLQFEVKILEIQS